MLQLSSSVFTFFYKELSIQQVKCQTKLWSYYKDSKEKHTSSETFEVGITSQVRVCTRKAQKVINQLVTEIAEILATTPEAVKVAIASAKSQQKHSCLVSKFNEVYDALMKFVDILEEKADLYKKNFGGHLRNRQ